MTKPKPYKPKRKEPEKHEHQPVTLKGFDRILETMAATPPLNKKK